MKVSLFIWLVLVVLGVSDAKTHRIPNSLLVLLVLLICISTIVNSLPGLILVTFLSCGLAFLIAFSFGILLHLLKVLAPGDVKLIAVLGPIIGLDNLSSYLFYVCLVTVFVGTMYWTLNRLHMAPKIGSSVSGERRAEHFNLASMAVAIQLGKRDLDHKITSGKGLTYMPFAPILVIGLALQQYYA